MRALVDATPMAREEKSVELDDDGKEIDTYRIDSAIRTLEEAEEIKLNKKLMAAIRPKLQRRSDAIKSVADLVRKRDKLRLEGR
jgi:hypothetical protein